MKKYTQEEIQNFILNANTDKDSPNGLFFIIDQLVRRGFVKSTTPAYHIWEKMSLGENNEVFEKPVYTAVVKFIEKIHCNDVMGILNNDNPIGPYFEEMSSKIEAIDAKLEAKNKGNLVA